MWCTSARTAQRSVCVGRMDSRQAPCVCVGSHRCIRRSEIPLSSQVSPGEARLVLWVQPPTWELSVGISVGFSLIRVQEPSKPRPGGPETLPLSPELGAVLRVC